MNRIRVIAAIAVISVSPAIAQAPGGPPPGFFPANMPNVGDLWIEFCAVGDHGCVDREAKIWGQVCESGIADEVVNGPKENASYIPTPPLMHWVGWRCGKDGELITPQRTGYYNDGKFVESGPH